jgi:hypothetical protein
MSIFRKKKSHLGFQVVLANRYKLAFLGGAEGIRTPDLLRAREALSQLSYSPMSCDSLY